MDSSDTRLSQFFTADHREADAFWVQVEAAAQGGDEAALGEAFERFDRSVRRHLDLEEQVLFPAFEQATGMLQGPTTVMTHEHRQMRALLDQLRDALQARDTETLLDLGDTLLTLTQQHNAKEEGMLYRMSEEALQAQWPGLYERAQGYR